jgi:hypothetical protein
MTGNEAQIGGSQIDGNVGSAQFITWLLPREKTQRH